MATPTVRLLNLLSLLQTSRDWPGSLLAERLGVSHRTVRRDVDQLREMGYNIHAEMGPAGGYRLEPGAQLPPLLFDDDQVVALAVALQSAATSGVGTEEAALRALSTIRHLMPSRLRHRLDALRFTTIATPSNNDDAQIASTDVLMTLSAAIRAKEVLRFDYQSGASSSDDELVPPRRVEPHHLVHSHGRWYLVAWDLKHDQWRIFRADRVSPRTPFGARFQTRQVPGGDVAKYVAARFKGSETSNQWPCVGKVILHLAAKDVVAFVGDAITEDLGSTRCSLELGSWSWVALAAALNRFDTDIDVVGPPELRQAFGLLAKRNKATASGHVA